jgi:sugar lactone lactonase YvrE
MPDTVGFVIPCDDGGVVAGVGMSLLHIPPGEEPVALAVLEGSAERRINDGTIAPDGTIWFGTMERAEEKQLGDLWSYHPQSGLKRRELAWTVVNGPAISPDGGTAYLAHSNARVVFRAAVGNGALGELREFVRFPEDWGYPDGMAVDIEGNLWIAHWGGGRLTRFDAGGAADLVVRVPTSQPTKCAFGGKDRSTMFITSASIGIREPLAGHLFSVPVDVPGPVLPRFSASLKPAF